MIATGRFGLGWAQMARTMGVDVEVMDFGFRGRHRPRAGRGAAARRPRPRDPRGAGGADRHRLLGQERHRGAARGARRGRASGAARRRLHRLPRLRPFRDGRLGRRRDGRRLPEGADDPAGHGLHLPRAARRRRRGVRCTSPYWDWGPRTAPSVPYERFCGTAPTHHLYGLRDRARHDPRRGGARGGLGAPRGLRPRGLGGGRRLGRGRRARAQHRRPAARAATRSPPSAPRPGDGARLRRWCADTAGVTLGIGLSVPGVDPDSVFRIGHMGHLNPPMLLGTLATLEAGFRAPRHPPWPGGRGGGGGGDRRRRRRRAAERAGAALLDNRRPEIVLSARRQGARRGYARTARAGCAADADGAVGGRRQPDRRGSARSTTSATGRRIASDSSCCIGICAGALALGGAWRRPLAQDAVTHADTWRRSTPMPTARSTPAELDGDRSARPSPASTRTATATSPWSKAAWP